MAISLRLLFSFFSIVASVSGLTPAQWRQQSIYQVLTDRYARANGDQSPCSNLADYCGGTWKGVTANLDYIQQMGFTAIWISPVVKNPIIASNDLPPDGNSYHGYWAQDAYSLNPKFGTTADLKELSSELHSRGMYLMVDVVPNHMGSVSSQTAVDYSLLNPFNKQSYFHPPCGPIDYHNDTSIKQCWLGSNNVALPDLKTENSTVASMWGDWISSLVANYSIDGLRIDTAQQINTGFWNDFQNSAGGIHTLGEVFVTDAKTMCPYQNYLHGLLNYVSFDYIRKAFQSTSGSIQNLVDNVNTMKGTCHDVTLLGSFIENHDNSRFPSIVQNKDIVLIRTAITFAMLQDGIPIIYQGQEQEYTGSDTPANRAPLWTSNYNKTANLYLHIQNVNKLRTWAIHQDATWLTYNAYPIYNDTQTVVMRKGYDGKQVVGVYSNSGSSGATRTITVSSAKSGFTAGQKITEGLRCQALTADSKGNLGVVISGGSPSVLYPTAGLAGSGICGL
ncbi:glycoside hydrolase family 13 protein [Zasmidium cellare ATCC 36951]|uniref:alpha-amylase n=1 Tax=Zasmidium cellare ATCC 36951 TaxID=1080233 RepID=A0A6A6CIY6_ZASCE|nr:glycoside hydrolase family 13 protein [Zasmidium cellare ATCC 36951]KAF2167197.1 glycoside hydrolase family 13 protein [Zasmidium cellare ATCC 36951]